MARHPKPPVKKNEEFEGEVIDISFQGFGVVKILDGFTVFVVDAIPGEIIHGAITKVERNYAYGRVIERLVQSPNRVDAGHNQLVSSGIAPLVNLKYSAQLQLKQHQIQELFKKEGVQATVNEMVGMQEPTRYRNKTVVPVKMQDGKITTGFYRRGSHKLVPIDDYYLNDPVIDQAIQIVRDILQEIHESVFDDEENPNGSMRYIMARRGYYSHEMMLVLVSHKKELEHEKQIVEKIVAKVPDIQSVILNINPRQTNRLLSFENRTLWGSDVIHDQLLGKDYVIGPNSFYQVNPQTTEVLYEMAAKAANLKSTDTVVDAYSGIGTIGLTVSDKVKNVIGVEVVESAVEDARVNTKKNNVHNADYVAADAPEQFRKWREEGLMPDVVFVDPPRKGLTPELIDSVTEKEKGMLPDTFVYISCNPVTLARDAAQIINNGYHIEGPVQPIDQFPQTTHVESITVFKK